MDKLDSLKTDNIGQSAAKPRIEERSTTIPKGSTSKILEGNGSNICIYALIDPETDQVRYVGKTKFPLIQRLRKHLAAKDRSYRVNWISQLKSKGLTPRIEALEECTELNWIEREKYWISQYPNLVNLTRGGESGIISPQCRKAAIIANTGRKQSEEEKSRRALAATTSKPVLQITGNKITQFKSASEAARITGYSLAKISEVANRRNGRKSYKGSVFQYVKI